MRRVLRLSSLIVFLILAPNVATAQRPELVVQAGHREFPRAVAFAPDGKMFVTASRDRTVKLWETGRLVGRRHPEGFFDGPPAAWNQIAWRFAGNKIAPVEIFFNEFYRPGLLAEVLDGAPPKAPRAFAQLDRRQPRLTLSRADGAKTDDEVTTRTIKVKLEVADAPAAARDVRHFRNGSLVRVWRGDVLQKGAAGATLEAEIALEAGANTLHAYAFNRDDIKSADATLELRGAAGLARKCVARLLAVGVNSYANPRYDLKYAVADAEPKDGSVFAKEWLDYAARRVPEIQLDEMARAATNGRELSFADKDRGLSLAHRQGQRPRLYYRRELEARPPRHLLLDTPRRVPYFCGLYADAKRFLPR